MVTCLALCVVALWRTLPRRGAWGRPTSTRDVAETAAGALVVAASSGLSLRGSLELMGEVLGTPGRTEVAALLRNAHGIGLSAALVRATGSLAPLFERVARATMSGAPITATIAGYLAEARGLRRAARLEAARRLPVRLTIPLALLILPGFVLITAGPAVIHSFETMLGPLIP